MHDYYERHLERLRAAQRACATREAFVPFEESPSRKRHPDGALEAGRVSFEQRLGGAIELDEHPGEMAAGEETSPYTNEPLGIAYPRAAPEQLFDAAQKAWPRWRKAPPTVRVGICMEFLDRLAHNTFENAFATMHTSGQAFMMAFAGSGANSLDRGLEALAFADQAMGAVPASTHFERSFGRGEPVRLHKQYSTRGVGTALVVTCGSYPAWNAYPAIFANLATGNPVIVKPHPLGVLPMAIAVQTGRELLAECGFDPNLLLLAVDSAHAPIAKELFAEERCAIVDFTGGQPFGRWLEENAGRRLVFTETSGCNSVIIESVDELEPVLDALAQGVALFSGQMCTAPQNFFIPAVGVRTAAGVVERDEVIERFVAAVDALVSTPKVAAAVCGAVQQADTANAVRKLTEVSGVRVRREPRPYAHPEFPDARTMTPLVAEGATTDREHFGPVAMFADVGDADAALQRATSEASKYGSIANYVYSVDDEYIERVAECFADAGASVGINLRRQRPINFTAAYSDYHVTGLNPAGNASLTDVAFVASRFRIVQTKREL